jgi:hypothetical protein
VPPRRVSLMFSGGVDSTTAALRLAEEFDEVHLLTWRNGYGHYRLGRTRHRADELRRHAGDRFVHQIESVKPLFERLVVDDLAAEYRRWGSGFIWCLGCKLAMHTASVLYNLRHGIGVMADGSSQATSEMVEQMPTSLFRFRDFYAGFGIRFEVPVYRLTREEEIEGLKRRGFRMGLRIGDRFLGVQPKCHAGELYYLPYLLLDQPPDHDPEKVSQFIVEKTAVALGYVERRCEVMGLPLRADGSAA